MFYKVQKEQTNDTRQKAAGWNVLEGKLVVWLRQPNLTATR